MNQTKQLIHQYYDYFNQSDLNKFIDLLHDEVVHDINQGESQLGKQKFLSFMERMNRCYREQVKDLIIMTNEDGSHAAAEFIIEGTYVATDTGLPPANEQHYIIPCGAFFQIKNNKIARVTNYYNLNDWLKQVAST